MPHKPHIAIVVGSTRANRFADIPLRWLVDQTSARDDLEFEIIDLRDHPLPLFELVVPPAMDHRHYVSPEQAALGALLDAADGFIFLTNEYNHAPSATLKNALDHYFVELVRKPVAFVGYGNVGGARAIEQLRQVIAELDMASVRPTVGVLGFQMVAIRAEGKDPAEVFAPLVPRLEALLADLHWWTVALRTARAADAESTDASDNE
jgi:NAD(P)H-dependent FMN reductase